MKIVAVASLIILIFPGQMALACRCVPKGKTERESISLKGNIFSGTVEGKKDREVFLKVNRMFLGKDISRAKLTPPAVVDECIFQEYEHLKVGERVVIAVERPMSTVSGEDYRLVACDYLIQESKQPDLFKWATEGELEKALKAKHKSK